MTYHFTATLGSLRLSDIPAKSDGTLNVLVDLPEDVSANDFTVNGYAPDSPDTVAVSARVFIGHPNLQLANASADSLSVSPANSPLQLYGSCFRQGEAIDLSSPQASFSSTTLTAGSYGNTFIDATVLAVHSTGTATVTATGRITGFHASTTFTTGGNRLDAGTELDNSTFSQLVSSSSSYRLLLDFNGRMRVCHFPPAQPKTSLCDTTWTPAALPISSDHRITLQVRTDGNLVLLNGSRPIWATGTVGAGNQLTMRDDGNLALTNAQHELVWSSATGLVRGAAGYVTSAYIAGSRSGRAVYVNGLIKQWTRTAQQVRGAHRLVYLQRYLHGGWQNMLTRTTDANGQLAVGFVQPAAYQYRLLVIPVPGVAGARSSGLVR